MQSFILFVSSFKFIAILLSLLTLAACDSGPSLEVRLQTAQELKPQPAELNEVYQRTCRNCHTIETTGAPLTGDLSHWGQLLDDNGLDGLVQNVINGKGGMPPFGLCMECNADQFQQLIQFMAQQ